MDFLHKIRAAVRRLWKRAHLTQLLLLVISLFLLLNLGYFAYLANKANVDTLKQGLAQSTVIYDKDGDVASKISANRVEGVSADKVPADLKNAIIAIEDHRFKEHRGFDLRGMARAFFLNLTSGRIRAGGSTITQQLTKNALLSDERTYKRKLEEIFLAVEIEKKYKKDEILEMYMNQIYMGNGIWGVQKASKKYFGKDVADLSLSESAMLAGIINRPTALDPYKHMDASLKRRNIVLGAMKKYGKITEAKYEAAINEPVVLDDKSEDPLKGKYPYYVDAIFSEAIKEYGLTQDDILTKGYKIYTEMDQNLQSVLEKVYKNDSLFPVSSDGVLAQSGAVLLDPKTGGLRALVGGRGKHTFRAYNRATQLTAQPGSVMKPLSVYVPALEAGYDAHSMLKDEEGTKFGDYQPKNSNGVYEGEVPMYTAVEKSLNVPAVWLLNEIGVDKGAESVRRFGLPLKDEEAFLSLALGGTKTGYSPKQMAQAYGAFANGGVMAESHIITKIISPTGNVVGEKKPKKKRVVDESTAEKMTEMLLNVVETGTGRNASIQGFRMAGKTGSTQLPYEDIRNGTKDQWFVGYTPNIVGAVWLGYDITDRQHYLEGTSSATVVPIFRSIMEYTSQYIEPEEFESSSINQQLEEKEKNSLKGRWNDFDEKMIEQAEKWKRKMNEGKGNFEKFKEKFREGINKFKGD